MFPTLFLSTLLFGFVPAKAPALTLESTLKGHTDYVSQLVFTADSKHVISASADKTLRRFAVSGEQLMSSDKYPEPILAMATIDLGGDVFIAGGALDKAAPYQIFKIDLAYQRQFGRAGADEVIERSEPHAQAVMALALTPDGTGLASVDASGIVRIWNGIPLSTAKFGMGEIADNLRGTIAGMGELQAKLKAKMEGKVYEPPKTKPVSEMRAGVGLTSLAFSYDAKMLAGGGFDKQVHLWEASTKKWAPLGSHGGRVLSVVWVPRTKTLISAASDGSIKVWDAEQHKELYALTGHTGAVYSLAVSADGTLLASGGKNGTLIVHNLADHSERYRTTDATDYVRSVAFAPGGHLIAAGDKTGTIRIYRMPGTRSLDKLDLAFGTTTEPPVLVVDNGLHTDRASTVLYTPDGSQIITGSWDKTVRVWDAASGQLLRVIRMPAYPGSQGMIYTMDLSPDGRFLAVAGASVEKEIKRVGGEYVLMVDFASGEIVDLAAFHSQVIFALAFSGDGKRLISGAGNNDEKALVYSVSKDGKLTLETGGQMQTMLSGTKLSKDGKTAFLCDYSGLLVRTDVDKRDPKPLRKISTMTDALKDAAGKDVPRMTGEVIGKSLMRGMAEMMGKEPGNGAGYTTMALDPTGVWVAVGDQRGLVQAYEQVAGSVKDERVGAAGVALLPISGYDERFGKPPGGRSVGSIDFSPDGKRVAVAIGNVVTVFDVAKKKELMRFAKHQEQVVAASFSPDGKRITSSSVRAAEVYVWDAQTGEEKLFLGSKSGDPGIRALGGHKTEATLIGYSNAQRVEKAFDLKNLRVVSKVDAADYVTAADVNKKLGSKEPALPDGGQAGKRINSYLGLPNGLTIYGTEYHVLYDLRYTHSLSNLGIDALSMAPGVDGNTFYVGYIDGRIEIYDQTQLKLIATLLVSADDEWLLYTPDGYYAASRNGARRVGWLINDGVRTNPKYYPFEQFDLRLNRPDIVLSRLLLPGSNATTIAALKKGHDKRVSKMGIKPELLTATLQAPLVSLGKLPGAVKARTVSVSIEAKANGGALSKAHVFVNDIPLFGSQGLPAKGNAWSKKLAVALTLGRNKIQVHVMDERGVESNIETAYVTCQAKETLGDLYVVAIGVSNYNDAQWKLDFAAKDALDLAAAMKGKEKTLYKKVVLVPLVDKQATKEGIAAAKKTLMKSKPDDEVVVFIAGHGLLDDKDDYYFGTVDIDFAKPADRGLPYDAIEGLLDGIPARRKLLLMDTCHSGEVDKDELPPKLNQVSVKVPGTRGLRSSNQQSAGVSGLNVLLGTLFTDLRRGSGAMVISSASGAQLAMEGGGFSNGVFTFTLLDGLKNSKADKNHDGAVRVSELRDYVVETVSSLTQGQQTPTSRRENLEFDFRVY